MGGKGGRNGEGGKGKGSARGGKGTFVVVAAPHRGQAESMRFVHPAVGPGEGLMRKELYRGWQSMGPRADIIDFYGHNWHSMGEWAVFSNFFVQSEWPGPFDFHVPFAFCACDLSDSERIVTCDFSEKAIMLCKAAASGDAATYREIAKVPPGRPDIAKKLGRAVVGFTDEIWDRIVCSVAFQVVHQKFAKTPKLRSILLKYDGLFAEMTEGDTNWGTGLSRSDEAKNNPSQWRGTNVLGWALTAARDAIRDGKDAAHFARLLAAQEEKLRAEQTSSDERATSADAAEVGEERQLVALKARNKQFAVAKSTISKEEKHDALMKVYKYVSGVLNAAHNEERVTSCTEALAVLASTERPSFASACDALGDAIEQGMVPPQGLRVLDKLADELPQHGVPHSARLPQALAAMSLDNSEPAASGKVDAKQGVPSSKARAKRWG